MPVCFLRSVGRKKKSFREMLGTAMKQSKAIDDYLAANPEKVEAKVAMIGPKENKKQASTVPDPPAAPAR